MFFLFLKIEQQGQQVWGHHQVLQVLRNLQVVVLPHRVSCLHPVVVGTRIVVVGS